MGLDLDGVMSERLNDRVVICVEEGYPESFVNSRFRLIRIFQACLTVNVYHAEQDKKCIYTYLN